MLAMSPRLLIALACFAWPGADARSHPARLQAVARSGDKTPRSHPARLHRRVSDCEERAVSIDPALVLEFGVERGVRDPNGSASCVGVKAGSLIPCQCPPDRDDFIRQLTANVNAGHAIYNPSVSLSFPTTSSQADQLTRLNAHTITLQSLEGPGKACPQVATNWYAVADAIRAGTSTTPAPSSPSSSPATAPSAGSGGASPGGIDRSLVVDFGVTPGIKDPNGSASCVGIKGILIPCQCPPSLDSFIADLSENVAAGHVVNNTAVSLTFPTTSSKADRLARMHAQTVTLQSLRGPGVGCPQAATTWGAVVADIQAS